MVAHLAAGELTVPDHLQFSVPLLKQGQSQGLLVGRLFQEVHLFLGQCSSVRVPGAGGGRVEMENVTIYTKARLNMIQEAGVASRGYVVSVVIIISAAKKNETLFHYDVMGGKVGIMKTCVFLCFHV